MPAGSQSTVLWPSSERPLASSGEARFELRATTPSSETSSDRPFYAERTLEDGFWLGSLSFRGSVRTSRRYHLLLPPDLKAELESYGRQRGWSLADAVRSLAALGLQAERGRGSDSQPESPATLATLTAAEHAVLMVASVLPEGQRRMQELAPAAASAAEERLAHFRDSGP